MMEIEWKKETIIFETLRESEVWADSIANEIHGRTINGDITPDYVEKKLKNGIILSVFEFLLFKASKFPRS